MIGDMTIIEKKTVTRIKKHAHRKKPCQYEPLEIAHMQKGRPVVI